jgi:hypothetical protein
MFAAIVSLLLAAALVPHVAGQMHTIFELSSDGDVSNTTRLVQHDAGAGRHRSRPRFGRITTSKEPGLEFRRRGGDGAAMSDQVS